MNDRPNFDDFLEDLIKQFINRRKELGLSQLYLDDKIGLAQGHIAKWETLIRKPTLWNAYCWAEALDCKIKLESYEKK